MSGDDDDVGRHEGDVEDRGDEDDQPVVDAGGGKEAEGRHEAENEDEDGEAEAELADEEDDA